MELLWFAIGAAAVVLVLGGKAMVNGVSEEIDDRIRYAIFMEQEERKDMGREITARIDKLERDMAGE